MYILYSTGCPKCCVLKKKLDAKHIEYETISDTSTMILKGIDAVPVLEVDGELLSFPEAADWVNKMED